MQNIIGAILGSFAAAVFAAAAGASAADAPREPDISRAWCEKHGGVAEFQLPDKSRADCYAPALGYAVEFDWAYKDSPYTCIGQARFYAAETGLNPMCILIRRPNQTHKDFRRHTRKALIGGGATIRCITADGEQIDCLTGEL